MPKFTANVHVHGENGPVFFEEGDELPDWAVGLVGAHVLESEPEADSDEEADKGDPKKVADEEPETDPEEDPEDEPEAAKADAPDFTAAAPRRGRARKA